YVRLSRHIGQTGLTISREAALKRLAELEERTAQNLSEFERFASREDPKRKKVEAELMEIRTALKRVEGSASQELRETYRQEVIRPYVYTADGSSHQLHLRNTGLIAVGSNVEVGWRTGPRRTRSDKVLASPLAAAGLFTYYE